MAKQPWLDVFVSCSDLKTAQPAADLHLRSIDGSLEERARLWHKRIGVGTPRVAAGALYKGQHWRAAKRAVEACRRSGWDVRLWIISAGHGLVDESTSIAAYSATFASGKADSVWRGQDDGARAAALSKWWAHTTARTLGDVLAGRRSLAVIVMGASYADALRADLDSLPDAIGGTDRVSILTTSLQRPEALRYSARMASWLRCPLGALNARLFEALVADASTHEFQRDQMQGWVDEREALASHHRPDRQPASDAQIVRLIDELRRGQSDIARTRALRAVRARGLACSQERFAILFDPTAATSP